MEIGDAFFFTREDIARIQSEADLLADFKDMFHKQSIVMMMEGGTNEDFNTVCTLLDCYNPYVKGDDSHSDELPLWVFSEYCRRRADSIPSSMLVVLLPELKE